MLATNLVAIYLTPSNKRLLSIGILPVQNLDIYESSHTLCISLDEDVDILDPIEIGVLLNIKILT